MSCPLFARLDPGYRVLSSGEKRSHSKTLIVFGQYRGKSVALKIFSKSRGERRGLETEVRIYRKSTALMRRHWTPNIVAYVTAATCSVRSLPPRIRSQLPFVDDTVGILVTERIAGPSVRQALPQLSASESYSIIFQVAHALAMLDLGGIRHADLHIGNVLLEPRGGATLYKFRAARGMRYFSVPTPYLVKIFDWDQGDLVGAPNPYTQQSCDVLDGCGPNVKADLYTFLSNFWYETRLRPVRRFIEQLIDPLLLEAGLPDGLFEQRDGFMHRLCRGPIADRCPARVTNQECQGKWWPADCLLATPAQIMQQPLYRRWRSAPNPNAWGAELRIQ